MVKVIIVDNEATFRKGLKTVLLNIGEVEIVAEATNGEEFLNILNDHLVDVVFMDIKMPIMDGIEATRRAKILNPEITIIGFSSYENQDYINRMLDAGANGYLSKSGENYDLLAKIMNNQIAGNYSGNKKIV
ncbi:MAG: response regulator transcription factor [Bacteroidetes bacterium]|nr:response regulator transcription factor [Bacteroidota bacterium]